MGKEKWQTQTCTGSTGKLNARRTEEEGRAGSREGDTDSRGRSTVSLTRDRWGDSGRAAARTPRSALHTEETARSWRQAPAGALAPTPASDLGVGLPCL